MDVSRHGLSIRPVISRIMQHSPDATSQIEVDIAIAGGSFAGMALAIALARAFPSEMRIALIDPRAGSAVGKGGDPRASAISAASRRLLEALGIWDGVAAESEPVRRIEITDTPLSAGIRPVLLSYDNALDDGAWASHIVPNASMARALERAIDQHSQIERITDAATTFHTDGYRAHLGLAGRGAIAARLVVAADGGRSALREAAGIKVIGWPHDQAGIVTTIGHDRPHQGVAVQHFLPAGPFALLPLPGDRSCITWSEAAERAAEIMRLPDEAFLAEIERRLGGIRGTLHLAGGRMSWPLSTHLARSYIGPRIALVGDAAHGVHPIAGQGLNLAYRDVAALAECVCDAARLGLDVGDATALERYQRWRRFDAAMLTTAFDGLNRLFSQDDGLLRSTREFGLGLVDRMPQLKRLLVGEAAGVSGELPRLLQGTLP